MAERKDGSSAPGYVVLHRVGEDLWQVVGEADRRPGQTARKARAQAVLDATDGTADPDEVYAVVLRSEWRIGGRDCSGFMSLRARP